MPLPDFQSLMLPLLSILSDGAERPPAAICEAAAAQFHLSEADLAILHPSGIRTMFTNRVAWALSYLKQAVLVESPRRGSYRITERGRSVFRNQPERINIDFLKQFPEFLAFRTASETATVQPTQAAGTTATQEASITTSEKGPTLTAKPSRNSFSLNRRLTFVAVAVILFAVVIFAIYGDDALARLFLASTMVSVEPNGSQFAAHIDVHVNESSVDFDISQIAFHRASDSGSEPTEVPRCIHDIRILQRFDDAEIRLYYAYQLHEDICSGSGLFAKNVVTASVPYHISHRLFLYPYDDISQSSLIGFYDNNGNEIPVMLVFRHTFSEQRRLERITPSEIGGISIVYSRPLVIRLLTPVLILLLLVFVILIQFIDELGAMAQVAMALVVGIWGSRQISIPGNIEGTVGLDIIYLVLYILLGASVLYRVLGKKSPNVSRSL